MLLLRLLAIFLVLITNTWLLNPVRSDALSRHKRALARRADTELSRLAGEPCTVSGIWRSRRQLRSISLSQHRPPAVRPKSHTSRRELYTVESAPAVCAGGCRLDAGARRVALAGGEKGGWVDTQDAAVTARDGDSPLQGRFYEKLSRNGKRGANDVGKDGKQRSGKPLLNDAGEKVSGRTETSPHDPRSRFARSLHGTFRYEEEGNSSRGKVSPDSSADSRGLQVLHGLQQGDGDQRSSATVTEDFSGEVEEADTTARVNTGGWGSPVPRVPPSWMTALYFNGRREQLKVKLDAGLELPRATFSLELWVKPEGGQSNPAVIAGECKRVITAH